MYKYRMETKAVTPFMPYEVIREAGGYDAVAGAVADAFQREWQRSFYEACEEKGVEIEELRVVGVGIKWYKRQYPTEGGKLVVYITYEFWSKKRYADSPIAPIILIAIAIAIVAVSVIVAKHLGGGIEKYLDNISHKETHIVYYDEEGNKIGEEYRKEPASMAESITPFIGIAVILMVVVAFVNIVPSLSKRRR